MAILNSKLEEYFNQKRSIIKLQTIILIAIFTVFIYLGLPSLYQRIIIWSDGYALGDWLINYEDGGFKRRGLSGTIFIFLAKSTGIYIGKIVFGFVSLLYICFCILLIKILKQIKFDFNLLVYCCLPTVFLFPINDLFAFGRKEILFLNIFLFCVYAYDNKDIYSWKFISVLSTILIIATLYHELIVFYVPYLMIVYLFNFLNKKKGSLSKIAVLGASTFIPAIIIFMFGKDINEGNSWSTFKELGVGENVMKGIFDWPKEGFGKGKVNALTFAETRNYGLYGISYILTLIVFLSIVVKQNKCKISIFKIGLIHLGLVILTLPLFFLTIDWGRWLNIHFICMAFFLLIFYKKRENNETYSLKSIAINSLSILNLIRFSVFTLCIFGFSMDHVDIGFKLGQNDLLIQIRDLIWNIRHINF